MTSQIDNINNQFNQRLSLATTLFSVKETIWSSWLVMLVGLLIGGFCLTLFEDDIKIKLRPKLSQYFTKAFKKQKDNED